MSIYPDYRTIYENNYGPIPIDNDGRTFEIHHIDGNHQNNNPSNLVALSIQDHYDIHYKQGDYAACILIAKRMTLSFETLSEISTKENLKRVKNGTHNWLGPESNRKRLENGTHNFLHMDHKGELNPSYDHTIYNFKHISGETYTGTKYQFRMKYNLNKGNLGQMVKGNPKFKTIKGWSMI